MLKFSLILPMYNVEQFLPDCLDSLLCQDLSEADYEIICVNDGSTDNSAGVVKGYMKRHSGIRLIEQENAGVSKARNIGFSEAEGEYTWFIDPDDMIAANCLGQIYMKLKENNADVFEFQYVNCKEEARFVSKPTEFHIDGYNKEGSSGSGWLSVCRTSYLQDNGIRWNEKLSYGEDYLWSFQVKYRKHTSIYTESALYIYRQRNSSAMHLRNKDKTEKHMNDMLCLHELYGMEFIRCQREGLNQEKLININHRQQLCSEAAMFYLMKLKLPRNELKKAIKDLREKKIYPYKYLTWNLAGEETSNSLKFRLFAFLFPFQPYYLMVCMLFRLFEGGMDV